MKRKQLKKILISSVVIFQTFGFVPWQVVPVFAEETTTSSSGTNEPLEEGDKVTKEDLSEETKQKLEDAEKAEVSRTEKETSSIESSSESSEENKQKALTIAEPLLADFLEKETQLAEQVTSEEVHSGKEEVLSERSEYSKTFIDPKTEEGETILFTSPIHEKDEQGVWQEIAPSIKETEQAVTIEETGTVTIPKTINEKEGIQVTETHASFEIGMPFANYEVAATNDNHVLLQSEKANEPVEIVVDKSGTEIAQYIEPATDLEKLSYQLSLSEEQTATFNKEQGGIEIRTKDKVDAVIPFPTLVSLSDEVIAPLTYTYDETSGAIHIKSIQKETLEKVGKAKISLRAVPISTVNVNGVNSTSIRQYDDKMSYAFQNYMLIGYDNGYSSGDEGAAHFQTYGIVNVPNEQFKAISRTHEIMSATLKVKRIGHVGFWGDTAKDGNGNIVSRLFEAAPLTKDVGSFNELTYDKFITKLGAPYGPPANEDGKETKLAGIDENNRWVDFDITTTANDWKNGLANYGILLKNNKMSSHEMPYSQAELFGGKGFSGAEPYVVLTHRERPPIDKNMPLKDTTMQLRPFVQSDNDGLVHFSALGLDGAGRPEAEITYRLKDTNDNNKVVYTGKEPSIGRDYLYPNYPVLFSKAQRYMELSSNWQTKDLLTSVLKENHLYKTEATITYTKNGKNESAEKTYDTFQLYKVSSQDTLPRLLAFYGLEKNRASFMRDNNMKDELLTQGNVVFIRNPKKNAGKAYTPKPLTNAEKIRLDSLAMGRGKHCQFGYEPINLGSGNFLYETSDSMWFDGEQEETLTRSYNAMGQGQDSPIGRNWTLNQLLSLNQLADKSMMFTLSDGGKVFFTRKSDGSYVVEDALPYTLKRGKEVVNEVEKRLFILEDTAQQLIYTFDATGQIRTIKNAYGQEKKYAYDGETGFLKEIKLFNGKKLSFSWNSDAHLTGIIFPDGTKNQYGYNDAGDLTKVTDALGKVFTYTYDSEHRMTSYAGNDGKKIYRNEYDDEDRVTKQTDAEGNVVTLSYGKNSTTTVDGNGNKTTTTYNDHYQPTKVTYPDGTTEISTYNDHYQLTTMINRKGQKTSYTYDNKGNLTSTTYPDGTKETTTYNQWSQPLVETNRQGKTIVHTYDEKGNELSITDENGNKTIYTYNGKGEKLTETNGAGQTTAYTYLNGNLASMTGASGVVFSYTYDARGLLVSQTDGNGKIKSYERNVRGELVKETNFNGAVKTYSYDSEGNRTSETDFNGNKTTYSYNKIGQVVKETNAIGGTKTYKYDGNGNMIEESDYLGHLKKMSYNSLNQRTAITYPDGSKTSYTYDVLGNVTKETQADGSVTTYTYDGDGYLIKETNAKGYETTYERNIFGQPTKIVYPNLTEEYFTYDALGNLLTQQASNGQLTRFDYNATNHTVGVKIGDRETKQTVNARGLVTEVVNPVGQVVQTSYDTGGFVNEIKEADGTKTSFEVDGEGNVLKRKEADGAIFQYSYDGNGNKVKEISPDGTTTLYTYNGLNLVDTIQLPTGDIEQYQYDTNGNVVKKIDPMGNTTTYVYTENNELAKVTDALGATTTFTYDTRGNVSSFTDGLQRVTTYEYNELNQLIKETTPMGVATEYLYDKVGNLIRMEDSTEQLESYTYNAIGKLTSVTDSLGRKELYTYNAYGELTSETDVAGNKTEYHYDPLGQVIKKIRPQGTEETTSYDTRGRVQQVTKHNGGTLTYEYDTVGQLVKEINAKQQAKQYQYNKNRQMAQLTDENGGVTHFKYDALGRVTETKDATGTVLKQGYDANGNVIKEIDGEGNETTYAYDALNQLVETVDAKGFKQTYAYDAGGRTTQETDYNGNETTFTYDKANNLIATIDALKRKTTFSYDLRNQLVGITDASGAKTTYSYHTDGTIASEENAKGYKKTYTYDAYSQLVKTTDNIHKEPLNELVYDTFGQVVKETRAGKQTTQMAYDNVGRLMKMTYPNQTSISYSYDVFDRVEALTDVRGNQTKMVYDGLGNVTELIAPNDAHTMYEYDGNNNLLKTTDPLAYATTFVYNKNGQIIETTDAVGAATKQTYTKRNQIASQTDARGYTQTVTYDGNGNQIALKDAKGKQTTFGYDAANRLTSTTNRLEKTTSYTYDLQDNVTKIIDANNGTTTFEYSPVGELEKQISASGKTETYSYRLDGQLEETKKANEETIAYSYDELNRLVGKQLNNESFIYNYDDNNELIQADVETTFDLEAIESDALKEKLPNSHTLAFERNQCGDIIKAITNDHETVEYAYDAFGRQTAVTYPNGTEIRYEYDKKNQLTKIIDGDKVTTYRYDGVGQVTEIVYGDGTKTTYQYLPTGEISESVTVQANGKVLSKQVYSYDENGNTIKEELTYPKFKLTKTYGYDDEDQLIQVTEKEKNTTRVTTYLYDNVGNRIASQLEVNGKSKGYQEWKQNADNQLEEITGEKGASYTYDANGNVSKKTRVTGEVISYVYDAEGRLIQETSNFGTHIGYYYDALGNRVTKAIGKETDRKLKTDLMEWMTGTDREAQLRLAPEDVTLEDALGARKELKCLPLKERTWIIDHTKNRREVTTEKQKKSLPANTTLEMIQYINDYTQEYVSPLQQTNSLYQGYKKHMTEATLVYDQRGTTVGDDLDTYHQDGLGSVITQTTKADGALYSSNLYQEYGRSERPIYDQAGYRSQYHENWKQQHLRAREYDATTGRFQQYDTVVGETGNTQSQHRYIYGNNNPLKYRDDAGRAGWLSNLWNSVKKTAKKVVNAVNKYIVKPIVNTVKKVVNTVAKVAKPIVNTVTSWFTGSSGGSRTVYPSNFIGPLPVGAVRASSSSGYNSSGYSGSTLYGSSMATARVVWYGNQAYNLNDSAQYATYVRKVNAEATRKRAEARVQKQCESASKISTSVDQQHKNLEKVFGKPNSKGQYYIPSPTGTGSGRWMSLEEAKQLTSREVDWKKVVGGVGLAGLTLLATVFAPEITIPSFSLVATTSGSTVWVVAGTSTVSLAPATSIAGTISIAGIVGNDSSGGDSDSSLDDWGGNNKQSDAEYHYKQHGDEVGAKDFDDYLRKANSFKDTVLGKGKAPIKEVFGKTPNVFRYNFNGKYIDIQHIMGTDSFGLPKIIDYKVISYGTI